jgi:NADH-quinone oxidoreductase subunit J
VIETAFYAAAFIAVFSTVLTITSPNPVHALLYLIVSLLAVAVIFFLFGAPFAAMLEIIVYAGAIMVLFIFVVMMLNLGDSTVDQERHWLAPRVWIGPGLLSLALFAEMVVLLATGSLNPTGPEIGPKAVGIAFYGPYLLAVELGSILLLAALVAAYHVGRNE